MRNFKFTFILLALFLWGCAPLEKKPESGNQFNFAFLTDAHLNYGDNGCWDGMKMAVENAKSNGIDFIMTGGDNVEIAAIENDSVATKLCKDYNKFIERSGITFYPAIGNNDQFWGTGGTDSLNGERLFEKYVHKSYYSFNHKGWHFIVLNTPQPSNGRFCVNEEQKQWLVNDLKKVQDSMPIIVSAHVPFLSVNRGMLEGKYSENDSFSNFREIWDLFAGKKLKLVLQGHWHVYEEIKIYGVQFITAGAVCAKWWTGPNNGTEEGYLLVTIHDQNSFSWKYIDYGWNAKQE
jgi:hypothetical protein